MLPFEGTLVLTLRLPIALDASDRGAAEKLMLAKVAEARSNGELVSARVEQLVAILAPADGTGTIPVRRVATETEELYEDSIRRLRRTLDNPVWHCFEARGDRYVGSGDDPDELWQAASGRDVPALRAQLPEPWRLPAWDAANEHARAQAGRSDAPGAAARRNEFLRGARYAIECRGLPRWYRCLWTDAYYGFRWARQRMEEHDTPEHQRLVQLEVSGEISIGCMRTPDTGTVYCAGGEDRVPPDIQHTLWRCLWHATHRLGGSHQRWRLRATLGQTDEQLLHALSEEFGLATYGYTGAHGSWETNPGLGALEPDPVFFQGILDLGRRVTKIEWRHTLRGPDLLKHVRALLRIPDADGHIPSVPLWEEALEDLVRLTPRAIPSPPSSPPIDATAPLSGEGAEPDELALPLFA